MAIAHASANEVAQFLIWLASHENEDDPDFLTPLRLQKLLYFVQGWTLAEWDSPMFSEPVEAWREGPVVAEVYADFKRFGKKPITDTPKQVPALSDAAKGMIRQVWNAYKRYSAFGLADMTHEDPAWIDTWGNKGRGGTGAKRIRLEQIKQSFADRFTQVESGIESQWDRLSALATATTVELTGRREL